MPEERKEKEREREREYKICEVVEVEEGALHDTYLARLSSNNNGKDQSEVRQLVRQGEKARVVCM